MTTNSQKKNLIVIFGGISPEHEVSVITGIQVLANADTAKYNVIPIYVTKTGKWYTGNNLFSAETYVNLEAIPAITQEVYINPNEQGYLKTKSAGLFSKEQKLKIDVILPCFHGGVGENGAFQGLFEIANVPYVGSNVLGSCLGMDKVVMKQILLQNNINVAPYAYFYKTDWASDKTKIIEGLEKSLTYPMFVKPANSGSSIGITKVNSQDNLANAIDVAFAFDRKVIVESGIQEARELNISVMGISGENLVVSEIEEVYASKEFLNYEDKYVGEGGKSKGMASTKRQIPAAISEETKNMVQTIAKKAFAVLNAGGLARIDFLVDEESNTYYLIEINTIPGSMSFYLWEATGLQFSALIDKLINIAEKTHELNAERTTTFPNNILKNFKPSLKAPKLTG